MGKTQTSIISLGQLRRPIARNERVTKNVNPLAPAPPGGFVNLSAAKSTVSPELISAVAPLGVLFADREKVTRNHQQMIKKFPERIPDDRRFLPPDLQQRGQVVINDYLLLDRLADQGKIFYQRPLELLATEIYQNNPGEPRRQSLAGVAHWVYDPLTNKWFLVQRWGRSEASNPIDPYRRWETASKKRRSLEYQLKLEPRAAADPNYPRVSAEQLAEKFRQRLLFPPIGEQNG